MEQVLSAAIPICLVCAVFWFTLFLPSVRQDREREKKALSAKKGDRVTTKGGIVGEVLECREDTLLVRSGSAEIEIRRGSVEDVAIAEPAAPAPKKGKACREPAVL